MPCRVDLFPIAEYYDQYDRINWLYFNNPMVPLLCEAMKTLERNNLTEDISPMYREILLKWMEHHKLDDATREGVGRGAAYNDHPDVMKYFIQVEKMLSNKK